MYVYIYIYIERESERERKREATRITCSLQIHLRGSERRAAIKKPAKPPTSEICTYIIGASSLWDIYTVKQQRLKEMGRIKRLFISVLQKINVKNIIITACKTVNITQSKQCIILSNIFGKNNQD